MRFLPAIILVAFAVGCGRPSDGKKAPEPAAPPKAGDSTAALDAAEKTAWKGSGADLRLYSSDPTSGEARKPSLWLHADACSMTGSDIWTFEKAHAVIYGKDEKTEEILLDAGEGQFQQDKMAYMKGGVMAKAGKMTIQLDDMEWVNEERLAKSDNHAAISSENSRMEADSVRLYPDENKIVLTHAKGTLDMQEAQSPPSVQDLPIGKGLP